jgi:hypothetical protein
MSQSLTAAPDTALLASMFTTVELSIAGILVLTTLLWDYLFHRVPVFLGHVRTYILCLEGPVDDGKQSLGDTTNFARLMTQQVSRRSRFSLRC